MTKYQRKKIIRPGELVLKEGVTQPAGRKNGKRAAEPASEPETVTARRILMLTAGPIGRVTWSKQARRQLLALMPARHQ